LPVGVTGHEMRQRQKREEVRENMRRILEERESDPFT
jgi:hypothetical protein